MIDKSKIITSRQKYPDASPKMDLKNANVYLQDLKRVFDAHGIPFFLFYGTLLGAVREQDFIVYDGDVDVAILAENSDKIKLAEPDFKKLGYYLAYSSIQKKFSQAYIAKKTIPKLKVDIYALFKWREKRWFPRYSNDARYGGPHIKGIYYSDKYFQNFETIQFKGAEYKVPSPPEEFLTELWGEWYTARGGQFGIIPAEIFCPPEEFLK